MIKFLNFYIALIIVTVLVIILAPFFIVSVIKSTFKEKEYNKHDFLF